MTGVASTSRYRIAHIDNAGDHLVIHWQDRHQSRFDALWLRYACECVSCGAYHSAIRTLRLVDIPEDIRIDSTCSSDPGILDVVWSGDGHVSRFDSEWLRNRCNSAAERDRRRFRPVLWDNGLEDSPPEADYAACMEDGSAHLAMLEALRDYGFVLVRGVPRDPDYTEAIASLAGPLRTTNYGRFYEFTRKPDALVLGDLNVRLDPHTDEPYRQNPPSVTCFHFVRASEHGGASTLTDGFNVGMRLKERDEEAFRLLSSRPITFYRRLVNPDRDFRMRAPAFSLDEDGEIAGIRLLDRAIGPGDLPDGEIRSFYLAMRLLQQMLFDPAFRITLACASGEALFFNNQRVLHGRTEFAEDSDRYMRSCNIETDEFHSTLRLLASSLGRDAANMNLPHGALS